MAEFFIQMAQFVIQAAVILTCVIVIIAFIASLVSRSKQDGDLRIKDLSKKFRRNQHALFKAQMDKKEFKAWEKSQKNILKNQKLQKSLFVVDFQGDIKASAVEHLREEITSILSIAKKEDQVVVKVESPGGMVHSYGLAASQLQRIREAQIPLTICVDKIAASGGYMMASIAEKVVAAPFAIIGSIGVIASLPNFNKILKKNDVDYLEITAGEYKRTLTPLGEITETGMKKFKAQIEEVHELFKNHVKTQRPHVDIDQVATGEYWYGQQAKDLKLVDEIGTSDDLIIKAMDHYKIFSIKHKGKQSLQEKISQGLSFQLETVWTKVADLIWQKRFQ